MVVKKHKAPPGLDYDPVSGEDANISYGTSQADVGENGVRRRLEDVIHRRFYPTERPDISLPWINHTAWATDVLPPPGAPDHLRDPQQLCREYHRKDGEMIRDLATIITIRFPEVDEHPSRMRLHEAWELSRGFGVKLTRDFNIAVVAAFHVPGQSWGHGAPHCHLLCPVRTILPGSGFTRFVTTLINADEGRPLIDREWRQWRQEAGYGD